MADVGAMAGSGELRDHPWQTLTRRHELVLVHRLDLEFDVERIRSEHRAIRDRYPFRTHASARAPGYDTIALVGPFGDAFRDPPPQGPYQKTSVLADAPYLERVIDSFRCDKRRVRLMRLAPKRNVGWHYDRDETLDNGFARLHLPIETSDDIVSQICHVPYYFGPGELWYGDFGFPHRIQNHGEVDRVHLVIDLARNAFVDALFGAKALASLTGHHELRRECRQLWHDWARAGGLRPVDGTSPASPLSSPDTLRP